MVINQILAEAWKGSKGLGSGDQDYLIMYSVARAIQATRVVEIGTYRGYSAIVFCQAIVDNGREPHVWTVDNWSQAPQVRSFTEALIEKVGFTEFITMVTGDSWIVLPSLFKEIGKVDLVFIDGSHIPEDVLTDFHDAAEYTDYMLLHDTQAGNVAYLRLIEKEGWTIISLPTIYVEGDGHLGGITLAKRNLQ